MLSEKRLFQNRMAKRATKHGKNWRQVFVDCGGMCIAKDHRGNPCCEIEGLQFHEPFGEDKLGWGIMQTRVLMCPHHQATLEHPGLFGGEENWYIRASQVSEDVAIEMMLVGGLEYDTGGTLVPARGAYDKWIKKFNLQDTFGRLLYA